ncbi:class I SAM-dependent rRNA methyltransferase [Carnobacterium viridans]|uniref:23S rRNA (Cytosine1962-C5)-methyltransferase n=1 Tax=Carnobacterium viridans TaxID=174587 RepID=A0A1H0YMW0_9LACT|nr:class I SAM-dependent rRNA methyltransferase [Carnobacterium viridans]UDE95044.1 class I SAM-dependent rRNA methyltransferase [Carnobacterium viridans]SDQ16473.1 23S rRNA (cytosine1962-C5)-methyltransferase [Carnobacterium viridans]
MEKYKLKRRATQMVRDGYPVLLKEDFVKEPIESEGTIVELLDDNKKFVARAYLAKQNKGDGWILTMNENEKIDQTFFERLFNQALAERANLKLNDQTNAYRFFNGEGDGLGGLTIDVYADYYIFSWYSAGIYKHQQTILKAFLAVVSDVKGVYEKIRYQTKTKPETNHVYGEEAPEPLLIKENGITFATYLNDGLMTGIFLDQRNVRRSILEQYSMDKTVLNTFSYTGAFSVAAAMGGASHTTSVDLANRSLEKTKEQFKVNGLDPELQTIRVMDVFDYFRYAIRKQLKFDTVVVDPPSFARSKKRTFSVSKDYTALLEDIIDITNEDGVIIASTNAANLSTEKFEQFIETAFDHKGIAYEILEKHTLPEDFKINPHYPQSDYLKVYVIQKGY